MRTVAEQEGSLAEAAGDDAKVGNATGIGLVGLIPANALIPIALGICCCPLKTGQDLLG